MSLNHRFLAIVYAILSLVSVLFLVLEKRFSVEAITGFWIVPAPAVLALAVTLVQWYNARTRPAEDAAKKHA